ncbi:hypothetical protein [Nocardia puris]|uniref:Uncharacterized protein n=1 Tax=Nocardia puris TaxID=208602 RepID=A0A366DML1_9NOCA|nr:hypothetical protein [Nocardia puris]RBO91333.1 hypothetical protein DFR74_10435 [Nocardia puris]
MSNVLGEARIAERLLDAPEAHFLTAHGRSKLAPTPPHLAAGLTEWPTATGHPARVDPIVGAAIALSQPNTLNLAMRLITAASALPHPAHTSRSLT